MPLETYVTEPLSDPTPKEWVEMVRQGRLEMIKELGGDAVESYFHGTNYPFEPGDEIIPQRRDAVIDGNGILQTSASSHEEGAWNYAEMRASEFGGRERVYRIVPSDGNPAEQRGPQYGEVNSPAFTVVEQIDVMPGRQGTIPEVNWDNYSPYDNANHPQDPPLTFNSDWQEPVRPSPDEVPLPGLGEDYVAAELERQRVASGRPEL